MDRGAERQRGTGHGDAGIPVWLRVALLLSALPLLSAWSLWGEESAEISEEECLQLAIEAEESDRDITLEFIPQGMDGWRPVWGPRRPSDYSLKCEPTLLRGCLLPPEEYSKVEEFKYRLRNCPQLHGCDTLAAQVGELEAQKGALQQTKAQHCGEGDTLMPTSECAYSLRQLEAVIDAVAMLSIDFEQSCF